MSFQVNSKTAIIITLSLGTITLPAGLQAHQYTGTNNKADNLSLSSDPISDLKSSLPDKKNDKEKNFQKNETDHHSKDEKNVYWSGEEITVIGKAERLAPSSVPLNITQPTSIIQSSFMANNIIPLASVDDIIKYQPSVWTQNPNGPGIGKAETMSLRGFQDGQYNMTFDGIPFGDASDLHHSTSSLFIAHFLGQAEVDRGPGTASTIGNATFGGTIGFTSRKPSEKFGITPYGTYGSYNTRAGGLEIDSGETIAGKMVLDLQHEATDGYLTHSNERRSNIMFKDVIKLGSDITLTAATTFNKEHQYTTQGATLAEYAQYGKNYGLCNDPQLQCFYKYNPSTYKSDFSYISLKAKPLSWLELENKVYSVGFEHSYTKTTDASQNSPSANGVTFYNAAGKKVGSYANDVPGKYADAQFRAYGDTLALKAKTPVGDILTGVWADVQNDRRYTYAVDLSQNSIMVPGKNGSAYSYNIHDINTTLQPYLEFDWHPMKGMTVKPGIKYSYFHRNYDAAINKNTKTALKDNQSFKSWQPSIAINQILMKGWSAYGQIARGFLAPPLSVFQTQNVGYVKPETTWNYQVGTVLQKKNWTISADGYYIDFSNYIASAQINVPNIGTETTYVNSGGAIYKGLEIEGQYAIGYGVSLYGNYSVNSAHYKDSKIRVAASPKSLASFGVLYEKKDGPYFSFIGKYVGNHWGLDSTTDTAGNTVFKNQYLIHSNITADMAFGWHFKNVGGNILRNITPSIKISNVFGSHAISDFAGNQSKTTAEYPNGAPLYWRLSGRSVFFNLTMTIL
ncbi:TonB-dependent receptor [Zymomonas mobilis]|uniref:TonB-dependent receptor n=1 Tax=Zymomonas mobilis TaxID=542 RepID=UPI0003C73AD0|nr:TonB-dependent receptor [Zymomonas mobilis]AHB10654.1 outer membrane receptor protein [Zymomonas mobilis subsp. mobilis str. CP4 = NRRL B-14023]AHJ70966.1 Outer membrane receptor for Fe3+-dicitrate [Zymomonas mobilis subsp. mobilis NRRL B-12526]AHJ72819.1 Outer membrane receptor for Fe3+-dicitrate [Zymomonas mobilis subsp. mobilis str. CP4 = NRRL B-14023]TWE26030.1 iron complex outermembrane receptor protein [Zymomonas mobilis]